MNIILVMSDTFRYDNLACYGKGKAKTPNLDRFAENSYIFDNAFLGSFPTVPNRLDIMSGKFNFIDKEWCPLPKDMVTLQQILTKSGYITQMIVDNPHLIEAGFNYERGFEGFEWIRGQELDQWKTAPKKVNLTGDPNKYRRVDVIMKRYLRNTSWWKTEEDRFAPRTIKHACQWLEENKDQEKFFLYLDLFDPHEPWDPPKKYTDLYDPNYSGEDIIYPHYDFWENFLNKDELEHIKALYLGECSMVDHWFGVLLNKIEELGFDEDTAIIFASDHGFLFGEHGIIGKSLIPSIDKSRTMYEAVHLYNEIRRTPILIHLPNQKERIHIGSLIQAPDLMPTILELAGLVASESIGGKDYIQALQCGVLVTEDWQFNPENIHGKSLLPLIRGEKEKIRDIVVCSNTIIHHTPIIAKSAIVTDDGWCLHYSGSYDEWKLDAKMYISKLVDPKQARISVDPTLFNIKTDPEENNDLFCENKNLARNIHERYVSWLEEMGTPEEHINGRRCLENKNRK